LTKAKKERILKSGGIVYEESDSIVKNSEYRALVNIAQRILLQGRNDGTIVPEPCVICGDPNVEGHHVDYRDPNLLIWLCSVHHRNAHKGVLQCLGLDTVYRTIDCHGNRVERPKKIWANRAILTVSHETPTPNA
jgi:hypothetical protein